MKRSQFTAGFWRLKNWGMTSQELLSFVEKNIELGITTMDHAMVYGSEAPFGEALAIKPELRQSIEIVSKCGIRPCGFGDLGAKHTNYFDSSRDYIIESTEASLKNLGTDYLDVLLIHRPDFLMDIDEMVSAFEHLKQQGKVRTFGVSNFTRAQFETLQSRWTDGLVTNQIEFSPLAMDALDNGVFEQCIQHRVQPMLWSCLAAGQILTPTDDRGFRVLTALNEVAQQIGADNVEQVVYAWVLKLPCKPNVLLGSSKIERTQSAVKAVDLNMSREQWYQIWEAANGAPIP